MVTKRKWFLQVDHQVKGPWQEEELREKIKEFPQSLIWGNGLSEWVTPDQWARAINDLESILDGLRGDLQPDWHWRQSGRESGPMSYDQLIQTLKAHPQVSDIEVRQGQGDDWKDLYSFPALVEEIGLTRRGHQRVPLTGIFRYEIRGQTLEALVTSLSVGGLGITAAQGLQVGDSFKGVIESPQLPVPISCQVEARYQNEGTTWGLRFEKIPFEHRSLIIEYASKFTTPEP
jgi:hypothetical protein